MNIKKLKDNLRTAELSKDPYYAIQSLEDFFRESDLDIDLWWLTKKVEHLCENITAVEQLDALHGLAETCTIDGLERIVARGFQSEEEDSEIVEELQKIKSELRSAYVRLVRSLP